MRENEIFPRMQPGIEKRVVIFFLLVLGFFFFFFSMFLYIADSFIGLSARKRVSSNLLDAMRSSVSHTFLVSHERKKPPVCPLQGHDL